MFPTEPRSIGGVIDAGIGLFRKTFKQTFPLALIAGIPYAIAAAGMSYAQASVEARLGDAVQSDPTALLAAIGPWLIAMYPAIFFIFGAVLYRLVARANHATTTLGGDLFHGLKMMIPLFILSLIHI